MDTPPPHGTNHIAIIFLKFGSSICSYQKSDYLYISGPCKKHEPNPRQ